MSKFPLKKEVSRGKNFIAQTDAFIKLVMNKEYRGDNPAMQSAYAPMRASVLVMVGITLITLVFGGLVPIDSAAIAKGSVVVISKRKTVQHLEGGIVKAILVEEGQMVKQGQPLMEISDVAPKAAREILQADLWQQRAAERRIAALRDGHKTYDLPEDISMAAKERPELAKTIQTQTELFATQLEAQQDKLKTLEQRIAQSREEIIGLQAQIKSGEGQLALITQESQSVQELLRQGLATRPRLLALQREAESLKGNRGQNMAMIAKAEQAINETQMQIINQRNEFATNLAQELREVREKISDHEEKLRAASDVMSRTVILSPSEGIVNGLKFHTLGGVVPAGAPIMDIVPQNDELVLEVRVQPADIDVVKPGLETRVVFPAYKSRRMPLLSGKISKISADAFTEQVGSHTVSYYTVQVAVNASQLKALENPVHLYPGMQADVFINTGSRSFISYMLTPITDSMDKAFREE